MASYNEIKREIEKFIDSASENLEGLSPEDYDRLLDEVFYERLKDKPSEEIKIKGDSLDVELSNTELLSTSPAYKGRSSFKLIDYNQEVVVNVLNGTRLFNNESLTFTLPFKNTSDVNNFIILLAYLDSISKIKYPDEDIDDQI